jgi:hypothetical protein
MKKTNGISGRVALWIGIWLLVLGLGLAFFGHWEMSAFKRTLQGLHDQTLNKASLDEISLMMESGTVLFWQVLAGSLIITGFLLWLTVRSSIRGFTSRIEIPESPPAEKKKAAAPAPVAMREEEKEDPSMEQRRALHLLSLLQREGRLVDFLQENLQAYDDAQIGAAVRGIQESCQKSLDKYVAPQPVMDQNEGDRVSVPAGFDPSAVKLSGNISGDPPFQGILQHRGWRAGHCDLPTLSGSQDPGIIAPAEVEIE